MILPSLPGECLIDVLSHLDIKSLYNCLSVNRYYCKLSIPIIWREPFLYYICSEKSSLVINTLLACLDEDETSSLIPCAINFNNQSPLFEYCRFVRKIDHDRCVNLIRIWLNKKYDQDCRVQKLVNTIYHAILRQSSNLQELNLNGDHHLPKISILTTGITNLRSIVIEYMDQEATEFLSMVPEFCNGIINFDLYLTDSYISTTILDIIKSQPLEILKFRITGVKVYAKKIIDALEFRSETLKELVIDNFNFQGIDLSFISRLGCLERLQFNYCEGFTYGHYEALSKKNLCLKELRLTLSTENEMNETELSVEGLFDILYSEALLKLDLNIITPKIAKVIKESCPNIYYLNIIIRSEQSLGLIIPPICELPSLRILNIDISNNVDADILARMLGDYLTFVECLYLRAHINLSSFEYFTNNCKSNLTKWNIYFPVHDSFRANYLRCVDNFQKVHNSLNVLGIASNVRWTDKELEIICSLENRGVNVVPFYKNEIFYKNRISW